jgi:hypothetical protein
MFLGLAMGLAAVVSAAQTNKPIVAPAQSQKTQPTGEYRVPLIARKLRLSDFAGMQPGPDLKDKLLLISGFIQNYPRDGQPATDATEVWMGFTKSDLYLVFICHDSHPGEIRGHLARRENILNDDNVSVLFDPFQDHRKGVLFTVNPAGVQAGVERNQRPGLQLRPGLGLRRSSHRRRMDGAHGDPVSKPALPSQWFRLGSRLQPQLPAQQRNRLLAAHRRQHFGRSNAGSDPEGH